MAAANWYQDPSNPAKQRWWNGAKWTSHVRDTNQPQKPQPPTSPQLFRPKGPGPGPGNTTPGAPPSAPYSSNRATASPSNLPAVISPGAAPGPFQPTRSKSPLGERLGGKWKVFAAVGVAVVVLGGVAVTVSKLTNAPSAAFAADITPFDDGTQIATGPIPTVDATIEIAPRNEPPQSTQNAACEQAIPGIDIGDRGFTSAGAGEGVPLAGTGVVGASAWKWAPEGDVGFLGGGGELAAIHVAPENDTQYIGAVKVTERGVRWSRALPHTSPLATLAGTVLWASAIAQGTVHFASMDVATGKILGCVSLPAASWSTTGGILKAVPLADGTAVVWTGSSSSLLEADGTVRWSLQSSDYPNWVPDGANVSTVVGEKSVYNSEAGESTAFLTGVAAKDGTEQWSVPLADIYTDAAPLPTEPDVPKGPFTSGFPRANVVDTTDSVVIVEVGGLSQGAEYISASVLAAVDISNGTVLWSYIVTDLYSAASGPGYVYVPAPYEASNGAPSWINIDTGDAGQLDSDYVGRAFAVVGRSLAAITTKSVIGGGTDNGEGIRVLDGTTVVGLSAGQANHQTSFPSSPSAVDPVFISNAALMASISPLSGDQVWVYAWEVNP